MVAVFNSMTFALKVTPLAVRSLSEGAVAVKRFQVRNPERLRATSITDGHYLSIPTGLKYSETSYLFCIRGANKTAFIDWQWPMFVFVFIDNIDPPSGDTRRRTAIIKTV